MGLDYTFSTFVCSLLVSRCRFNCVSRSHFCRFDNKMRLRWPSIVVVLSSVAIVLLNDSTLAAENDEKTSPIEIASSSLDSGAVDPLRIMILGSRSVGKTMLCNLFSVSLNTPMRCEKAIETPLLVDVVATKAPEEDTSRDVDIVDSQPRWDISSTSWDMEIISSLDAASKLHAFVLVIKGSNARLSPEDEAYLRWFRTMISSEHWRKYGFVVFTGCSRASRCSLSIESVTDVLGIEYKGAFLSQRVSYIDNPLCRQESLQNLLRSSDISSEDREGMVLDFKEDMYASTKKIRSMS